MADLFWPGDERAGDVLSAPALLAAMTAVEAAWLDALVTAGVAPAVAKDDLRGLVDERDVDAVARAAESGGNPAAPLVDLLRARVEGRNADTARWLHRGLTSQDVVDTALVLAVRDGFDAIGSDLRRQARRLAGLVEEHRDTPMVARTLTQHAVPTTFGLKAAGWLTGVLDAAEHLDTLRFPAQLGGAAGSRAATVELAAGQPDPPAVSAAVAAAVAGSLGLDARSPWHTTRSPVTRFADAAVACTDAWGHLAGDVLQLGRPEVAEVAEGTGGGSSTMPHKANPVLSVLVRRAALIAPQLAATLHLAAAGAVDERPDGAWHAEWAALRTLLRATATAGSQVTALLEGLRVHPERMAATLAAAPGVRAEQEAMAALAGHALDDGAGDGYRGETDRLIDAVLARAAGLEEAP